MISRGRIGRVCCLLALWGLFFGVGVCHALEVAFSAPEKVRLGEPFMVSVSIDGEADRSTLSWRGKNIPLDLRQGEDGVLTGRALLGTDSVEKTAKGEVLKIWVASRGTTYLSKWPVDIVAKDYPSERLSVDPAMVTPPSSARDRIARERRLVRKALGRVSKKALWELPIVRPVPGAVTSLYGKRRVYNGVLKGRHGGVDYRAANGTPAKAAASGEVILTGDHYYAGKSVYIDHGGTLISMYFHLSRIDVKAGQVVSAGDVIGLTGSTGRVTGPHLHFGVAQGGRMMDPAPLIELSLDEMSEANSQGRMVFK
nr:M23 family metallopeptidase [uncultured Dethiosulfovibrio sp.]